eukprot:XP_001699390.1 predicted protein [Chlamydomonas reinhardtii]
MWLCCSFDDGVRGLTTGSPLPTLQAGCRKRKGRPLASPSNMQLHTLAYLDPAAASRQRSMRDPRAAPTVATTVVRHGGGSSLDGSAATGAWADTTAPPPPLLEGMVVVERQDPADKRRASASTRIHCLIQGAALADAEAAKMPGPGAYDVPRPVAEGPAFTLKGRPKGPSTLPDDLPGPGEYYVETQTRDGPAFTLAGKPKRKLETDAPGPGAYVVSEPVHTGPAHTIAGRPKPRAPEQLPGPQDYQQVLSPGREGPAFTIGGRLDQKATTDAPAPGDYDLPNAWRTGPAVTFAGKPAPRADPEPVPGPGQYYVPPRPGQDLPAFSFGVKPAEQQPDDLPGPGAYYKCVGPLGSPGPAFTLAGRPAEPQPDPVPGPGAYDPEHPASPGREGPAYTFGARPPEHSPPASPGPGTYRPEGAASPTGPAYTMATRPLDREAPDSPGPGAYEPQDPTLAPGPAFTMGTRPVERDPRQDLPAPGDYQPEGAPGSPSGPAYTMRGRPLEERAPDSPGEYSRPASPSGPAYSMRGKPVEPAPDLPFVGPGAYDPERPLPDAPAYTLRGRPRDPERPPSPGPGEHEECKVYDIVDDPDIPGPGFYGNPDPDPMGRSGPAYTMRPRYQQRPPADLPGPGDYEDKPGPGAYAPPVRPDGPAYTIAPRVADPAPDPTPAPGEYGSPGGGPSGPAWSLGQRLTDPDPDTAGLGPGEYYSPGSPSGPAYTMGAKFKSRRRKKRTGPDPGQYFKMPPPSGPAWTLGPRSAGPSPDRPDVGPGDYDDNRDLHSGPAWTLRPRHASPTPDPVPGPGNYNDNKPFPNPLGTVISRPRAVGERDGVDSMDMTYGGRVRPEEPTVSGRGGAMVPPPRGAPPVPVLPPPPPRESGVSAGTSYPHYPPRQAAHAGELGDVDAAGQRVRGGRAVSRERPQRGAAARPSATATDAREAAVERAMALLRQDALQQRYLLHAGGPPEGGQWESMILARGAPAAAFTQQEGLAVGNVSPGRHRPAAVAGQQRAPSAGRQRSNKGVQQQLQQHRPAGQGVSDTSGGFPFQRPVTHAQQQLYVAGLQAHRAAGPAVEAHIPEPPAPPPIPATAAEREAAAAAQRVAGRAALQLAAVEGRRAEGLGGPPAMTQGPLGVPVARARRRLEMGGPGGPSVVGLSPREAALARAAAYMAVQLC